MEILSSLPSESVLKIKARARVDLPDFAERDFLPLSISIMSPDISARLGIIFYMGAAGEKRRRLGREDFGAARAVSLFS